MNLSQIPTLKLDRFKAGQVKNTTATYTICYFAVYPPSTGRAAPVTQLASSDAR